VGFGLLSAFAQLSALTSRVVIVCYSMPIWASLLAWLILGERLNAMSIAGLVLWAVLMGVGGAAQGLPAAAALKGMNGDMQGRFLTRSEAERAKRASPRSHPRSSSLSACTTARTDAGPVVRLERDELEACHGIQPGSAARWIGRLKPSG